MVARPLTARLRTETRSLHAALDRSVRLLDPHLTKREYGTFLAKMWAWLAPVERRVADGLPPSMRLRQRASLLRADLEALNHPLMAPADGRCLPPLQYEPFCVGAYYVIEGSALGGEVIGKHVRHTLKLTEETGASYYGDTAFAVGARWRTVCAALDAYDRDQSDEVVEGAKQTFMSLHAWLTK